MLETAGLKDLERLLLGKACPNKECASEGGEIVGFKSAQTGVVLRGGTLQKGAAKQKSANPEEGSETRGATGGVRFGALERGSGAKGAGDGHVGDPRKRFLRGADRRPGNRWKRGGGRMEEGEQVDGCRDEVEETQVQLEDEREQPEDESEAEGDCACERDMLQEQLDRLSQPLGKHVGKGAEHEAEEEETLFPSGGRGRACREQERKAGMGEQEREQEKRRQVLSLEEFWAVVDEEALEPGNGVEVVRQVPLDPAASTTEAAPTSSSTSPSEAPAGTSLPTTLSRRLWPFMLSAEATEFVPRGTESCPQIEGFSNAGSEGTAATGTGSWADTQQVQVCLVQSEDTLPDGDFVGTRRVTSASLASPESLRPKERLGERCFQVGAAASGAAIAVFPYPSFPLSRALHPSVLHPPPSSAPQASVFQPASDADAAKALQQFLTTTSLMGIDGLDSTLKAGKAPMSTLSSTIEIATASPLAQTVFGPAVARPRAPDQFRHDAARYQSSCVEILHPPPAESPQQSREGSSLSVVDAFVRLVESQGGKMSVRHLHTLHKLHPRAKEEIKAAGGVKGFCRKHAPRLRFVPNASDPQGVERVELATGGRWEDKANERRVGTEQSAKAGNWHCLECGNVNFARRSSCNRCGMENLSADSDGARVERGCTRVQGQGQCAKTGSVSSVVSSGSGIGSALDCLVWVLEDQGGEMEVDRLALLYQLHPTAQVSRFLTCFDVVQVASSGALRLC